MPEGRLQVCDQKPGKLKNIKEIWGVNINSRARYLYQRACQCTTEEEPGPNQVFLFCFVLNYWNIVGLQYLLASDVKQSESVIYMHRSTLLKILFLCRPLKSTEQSSLCYTIDPCCCSVVQLCPALCDPIGFSPPGSSVHGISLARILEWIAISFSWGSPQTRDLTHNSCICRHILNH